MFCRAILAAALLATPVALHAAPKKPSLEQRVQRMEDESTIRKVVVEYGAFLDAKDYASYAGLFAPDGVWVGGFGSFTGPAAIRQMLETNLGKAEAGYVNKTSFHMLTNPLIEIDGDTAHVTSKYLFWTKSADNKPVPALAGTIFFFARLPAIASIGTIMKNRPSSIAAPSVELYQSVFAERPANAEPLLPVPETNA